MIKKAIASILLVTIALTTFGSFLLIPRKAQAQWANLTIGDIPAEIREAIDKIWEAIKSHLRIKLKNWLVERIEMWGRGEITGAEIFQDMPWKDWLKESANEAAGEFLNDFFDTNLCEWTNPEIKIILKAITTGEGAKEFECTLTDIGDRLEDVFDPEKGGWDKFLTALETSNNDIGVFITAQAGTLAEIAATLEGKKTEAIARGEYKAQEKCVEWVCYLDDTGKHRLRRCSEAELNAGASEQCQKFEVITPAADIASTFKYIATINLEQIVHSEDLAEILSAFVSALVKIVYREISSSF